METKDQCTSYFERQLSVLENSVTLTWSNLTAAAPAPSTWWRQHLCSHPQDQPAKQDKVILDHANDKSTGGVAFGGPFPICYKY